MISELFTVTCSTVILHSAQLGHIQNSCDQKEWLELEVIDETVTGTPVKMMWCQCTKLFPVKGTRVHVQTSRYRYLDRYHTCAHTHVPVPVP